MYMPKCLCSLLNRTFNRERPKSDSIASLLIVKFERGSHAFVVEYLVPELINLVLARSKTIWQFSLAYLGNETVQICFFAMGLMIRF
jgi:hypothetical protein